MTILLVSEGHKPWHFQLRLGLSVFLRFAGLPKGHGDYETRDDLE